MQLSVWQGVPVTGLQNTLPVWQGNSSVDPNMTAPALIFFALFGARSFKVSFLIVSFLVPILFLPDFLVVTLPSCSINVRRELLSLPPFL